MSFNSVQQSPKLFDRHYCINALANIRRCPNCRQEFTAIYDKRDANILNRRPVLFPCGHNMCENCVWQNRYNLQCHICMRPVEIPPKYLKSPNFSLRDVFDLDFFVIGEKVHYFYFRKNNSTSNHSSLLRKEKSKYENFNCNECENSPALGSCQQCKVHFCEHCFTSVHMRSKVLKSHMLMPLKKNSSPFPQINLSVPHCIEHQRLCKIWCKSCQVVACNFCSKTKHNNHITLKLREQNALMSEDIADSLNTLKVSRESIAKSLKQVKSVEKQLDHYATETLEFIKVYFMKLHSFLQIEEARIIKDFERFSLEPQQKLEKANLKLNESQVLLDFVRTEYEHFLRNPPENIYLGHVIQSFNQNIDQLDCRVQISRVTQNPFEFQPLQDFKKDFQKFINYNYNDPNITIKVGPIYGDLNESFLDIRSQTTTMPLTQNNVCLSSDYNSEVYNSLDSSIGMVNKYDDMPKSILTRSQKRKKHKADNVNEMNDMNVMSDCHDGYIMEFPSTDDEMAADIEEIESVQVAKSDLTSFELQKFGKELQLARLSKVNNPQYFYITNLNVIQNINRSLLDFSEHEVPKQINVGDLVLVYNIKDHVWHRALIKKQLENDEYQMFLVDVGVSVKGCKNNISEMSLHVKKFPFAALLCCLRDIEPNGNQWTPDAKTFFIELTRNKPFNVQFLNYVTKNCQNIEIFVEQHNENISVRDAFLYSGLARERPNALSPRSMQTHMTRIARINQRLPKFNLHPGEMSLVNITYIDSPSEFYTIKVDLMKDKEELFKRLNDDYGSTNSTQEVVFLPAVDMCCAGRVADEWHRVCVQEIESPGTVRVRLVDEGPSYSLNWRELKVLGSFYFKQKEFAIKCALAGIEPKQSDGYVWTETAIAYFKQLSLNPKLQMHVVCVNNNNSENKVTLNICKKNLDIDIATALTNERFGLLSCSKPKTITPKNNCEILKFKANDEISNDYKQAAIEINRSFSQSCERHIERTPIQISYIYNPSEFYVYILNIGKGIEKFHQVIQESHMNMDESMDNNYVKEWNIYEHCLVFTSYKNSVKLDKSREQEAIKKWYRGIIIAETVRMDDEPLYTVFLRDIGATVESISSSEIRDIDKNLDRVADAAIRCHLACIGPTGASVKWSESAIDFLRHCVGQYESLAATLYCETSTIKNSMPIILWGIISEIIDALAPDEPKKHCINHVLVKVGLAHKTANICMGKTLKKLTKAEDVEGQITIADWFNNFDKNKIFIGIDNISKQEPLSDTTYFEDCGHYEEYLTELDTDKNSLNGGLVPENWLKTKIIEKSIFTGYSTYVDYDCLIYIHHADDDNLLKTMCTIITKTYADKLVKTKNENTYKVGQGCTVKYHNDHKFYRGIIQNQDSNGDYEVKFIDYGNTETCTESELLPYMPFPKIPAIACPYKLLKIRPLNGKEKHTISVLDIIHQTVVDKMISVRVPATELNKPIKYCEIRAGTIDVIDFLIDEKLVEFDIGENSRKSSIDSECNAFKQLQEIDFEDDDDLNFDFSFYECKSYEKVDSGDVVAEDSTMPEQCEKSDVEMPSFAETLNFNDELQRTIQQPSKKRMLSVTEIEMLLIGREDRKLTLQTVNTINENDGIAELEKSFAFKSWHCDDNDDDDDDDDDDVDDDSDNDVDVDDDSDDVEHNKPDTKRTSETSIDDKMTISSAPSDFDSFKPNETSTELPLSNCLQAFVPPTLPVGLNQFPCIVIGIESPTIIYIFPSIKEYEFHSMEMINRIKYLAKSAQPLKSFTTLTPCLARYTKDKIWYRAIIRGYNPIAKKADVIYVDYLNSETLSLKYLKQCPKEILKVPLHVHKVRLFGINANPNVRKRTICDELTKIIVGKNLTAVIKKPESVPTDDLDRNKESQIFSDDLAEIELYDTNHTALKAPVYRKLIKKKLYCKIQN